MGASHLLVAHGEAEVNNKGSFLINILAGILLLASCAGPVESGPTSTPDPLTMGIEERTIWELEILRNEIKALAEAADDTPVEDLEPILKEMNALWQTIPEFPLFAARAGSALREYGFYTEQCYFGIYAEYLAEKSGMETMMQSQDHCDRAQVYEETLDLYLQEMKETNASE